MHHERWRRLFLLATPTAPQPPAREPWIIPTIHHEDHIFDSAVFIYWHWYQCYVVVDTTRYANNQIMLNCIPSSALSNYPCDQLLTSYNIVLECVHRQDRRRPSPPGSFCPGNICIKVEAWISVPYFQRVLLIHHRCTSIVVSCKMSA